MGDQSVLPEPSSGLSRRGFLIAVAGAAAVAALPGTALAKSPRVASGAPSFILRRREDLLRITVHAVDMTVDADSGLLRVNGQLGRLVMGFGPQSLVEEAFPSNSGRITAPVGARLSGPSQIAFEFDPEEDQIGLSLDDLLDWTYRRTSVPTLAQARAGQSLTNQSKEYYRPPRPWETAIEMPWWLILAPHQDSRWQGAVTPVTRRRRTEIFHARLGATDARTGARVEGTDDVTVRGVWIQDPGADRVLLGVSNPPALGGDGYPFEMIPSPRDRADIVRLSTLVGDEQIGGAPAPVKTRLAMTSLGGHLDAAGAWNEPGVSSLAAWQQRIWQGRDTYAKIVRRGFLYPWGLKAAYVEEGVRRFSIDRTGGIRPFWFKIARIVVTEPTVDFLDATGATGAGQRGALFSKITCTTKQTPELVLPANARPLNAAGWSGAYVFTPATAGPNNSTIPFEFSFIGIDPNGNEIPFTQPLLFAEEKASRTPRRNRVAGMDPNYSPDGSAALRQFYSALGGDEKTARFAGQAVAYAEEVLNSVESPTGEGIYELGEATGTSQVTEQIVFDILDSLGVPGTDDVISLIDGLEEDLLDALQPRNLPFMREANVLLEDASRLAGQTITAALEYPREFLESGLDEVANVGKVYLQKATNAVTDLALDAAKAGGIVVPKVDIAGLSASAGAVYGSVQQLRGFASDGRITPGEALAAIKLLGGVSLADILPESFPGIGSDGKPTSEALQMSTTIVDTGLDSERAIVTLSMDWAAGLVTIPLLDVSRSRLKVTSITEVPTVGGDGRFSVEGAFTDFTVTLVPGMEFVQVVVDKISFTAGTGRTPDIDVAVKEIDFGGLMSFIKSLASYLPFGDSLSIDVDTRGISAGLSLELPSIALGVLTINSIGVKTGLTLPFGDGPVRFRFGMSGMDDPFSVTVSGLGGGGWLGNDLGVDGIERVDVALFAEAKAAVDFGVASGSASVKIGLQFTFGAPSAGEDEVLALTAFARADGRLSVLGIATVSVNVYIGLTVEIPASLPGYVKLKGQATCTVHVSVAFFSKSVSFTAERSINGTFLDGNSPPLGGASARNDQGPAAPVTFADTMPEEAWAEFCEAFA